MGESLRAYVLWRAQAIADGVRTLRRCPKDWAPEPEKAAWSAQVALLPSPLHQRGLNAQTQPDVQVTVGESERTGGPSLEAGDAADEKREELGAVVSHVVFELKGELVVELMEYMRPGWCVGKETAPWDERRLPVVFAGTIIAWRDT